ncbi:Phosphotyrosine protein phosphatases superfamily [Klebsormidium nitens]|uniref:diphosphoinositol-polyphosphate diphosphatase n=1 Tax=Klebsormidium nitens TaxID=105231 RepID=A0A1Y1I197_KLENI|nr:Phosphotyrosine protein phosphatases superfamily [Klebsormidium nitens]|eukprot:GAQ82951.1 Phosphotyrosine protein phosphatases superfamily [Klebsormidium nitens]
MPKDWALAGQQRGLAEELFIPPTNFSMVDTGVYRSGYPNARNLPFLSTLGLRSIIYLCPDPYPDHMTEFVEKHQIKKFHFGLETNKDPAHDYPEEIMKGALLVLLDVRNRPLLIHCNKGKHRTGALVGCLRRMQRWMLTPIFDEYRRFAGSKARLTDQQYIELFDTSDPVFVDAMARNRVGNAAQIDSVQEKSGAPVDLVSRKEETRGGEASKVEEQGSTSSRQSLGEDSSDSDTEVHRQAMT